MDRRIDSGIDGWIDRQIYIQIYRCTCSFVLRLTRISGVGGRKQNMRTRQMLTFQPWSGQIPQTFPKEVFCIRKMWISHGPSGISKRSALLYFNFKSWGWHHWKLWKPFEFHSVHLKWFYQSAFCCVTVSTARTQLHSARYVEHPVVAVQLLSSCTAVAPIFHCTVRQFQSFSCVRIDCAIVASN